MKADDVRQNVSEAYSRVLNTGTGCCGAASCCGGEVVPKGVAAKVAGYDAGELANLPADAVESSFGCGNPVAFAEVRLGDTVLDLGSGAGIDILLAAKKAGELGHVIGVDMTDDMLVRARSNIAAAQLDNVEVRKGLIEELPVADASVDLVISNCVINLSPEKDRVFSEIARVLKPGGRMLVSDIVVQDLPDWVRESTQLYASCIAGAVDEDSYLAGLRAAGLHNVEVRERLVYDVLQLSGLIGSEINAQAPGDIPADLVMSVAEQLQGKIWSARVYAQKPGVPPPHAAQS